MANVTISTQMKKDAIEKALVTIFSSGINQTIKKFNAAAEKFAANHADNKALISKYRKTDEAIKPLVNCTGAIYFDTERVDKKGTERIHITIAPQFELLGGKKPFSTITEYYQQKVSLTSPLPLSVCAFTFKKGREPKFIKDYVVYRKNTLVQLHIFVKDMYHALYPIKNLNKLREHLPAMEQYFDIPDAEFTKLVPTGLYDRLNNLVK